MVKIERTLEFCVPDDDFVPDEVIERHRRTLPVRDRPMSWVLFIPALIILRTLRFNLSLLNIIMGKGEITSQLMQRKVIAFRRYYRSIRHFAITLWWKEEDFERMEVRKKWQFWRIFYHFYEKIFMIRPLVEVHGESRFRRRPSPLLELAQVNNSLEEYFRREKLPDLIE